MTKTNKHFLLKTKTKSKIAAKMNTTMHIQFICDVLQIVNFWLDTAELKPSAFRSLYTPNPVASNRWRCVKHVMEKVDLIDEHIHFQWLCSKLGDL